MWDKLQARGWEGPSRCILCKSANESTLHVFFFCPFVRAIWTGFQSALKITFPWSGSSAQDCMCTWFKENNTYHLILIHLCWHVWKARNEALFQEKTPSSSSITNLILAEATSHRPVHKTSPTSGPALIIPTDRTVAWFDGASQKGGTLCGAEGKIVLSSHSSIRWTLNCGTGSNTKAELVGAWASLVLASRYTEDLILLGDSKLIIDWLKGLADFQVAALARWKERTKEVALLYKNLAFKHIFLEENSEADILSKNSLLLPSGHMSFAVWEDGNEGPSNKIKF